MNLLRNASIGALNGTGVGIFPLGPKSCPSDLPTTGISFVSAKKKSYLLISFLVALLSSANLFTPSLSKTSSAFASFAFRPISPEAITQTAAGFDI